MEIENKDKYGLLLSPTIKIHRKYFDEMLRLLGITVIYYQPKPDKHYTTYAEIKSNYFEPIATKCIFNDHPNQVTLRKLGWVSELSDSACIIQVPYDLPGIQQGALFIVPSGLDDGKGRLFRVTKMSTTMVYPSCITCEIVPEYYDSQTNASQDYSHSSFNNLAREDDEI